MTCILHDLFGLASFRQDNYVKAEYQTKEQYGAIYIFKKTSLLIYFDIFSSIEKKITRSNYPKFVLFWDFSALCFSLLHTTRKEIDSSCKIGLKLSRQLLSQHKHCQTGFFFVRNFFQAGGQSTKCIYNILMLLLSSPTKSFWEWCELWKDQSQTTTTKIVFYAWHHPTDDILLDFYGIRWLEKYFKSTEHRKKMGEILFHFHK